MAALCGLATVVSFLGALDWRADLLAAFRLHLAVAFLVMTPLFALSRRTLATVLAALALVVNAAPAVTLFWPAQAEVDTDRPPLRVLAYNAANGVGAESEIAAWIASSPADIAIITEVTPELLAALQAKWPVDGVVVGEARRDNFGIALLAREIPALAEVVRLVPDADFPAVVAEFRWSGRRTALLGIHPPPPVSTQYVTERDRQLEAAAFWARESQVPVIVAGDLNVTRFSPAFDGLLESGDLADSAEGFGWQPTWPASFGPLGIPIDHVLHGPAIATTERDRGPSHGSDHRPVLVELRWRLGAAP